MSDNQRQRKGEVLEQTRRKTERPPLFKVILHNDDYTPMDFVVDVLESIFERSPAEAYHVMMQVHNSGAGVAGVYEHEIAETKAGLVLGLAHELGHPLHASVEPE